MPDSGFPFFCALGFVARIAATGPFFLFPANRSAPKLRPSLVGKQGGAGAVFLFPADWSRAEASACRWPECGAATELPE